MAKDIAQGSSLPTLQPITTKPASKNQTAQEGKNIKSSTTHAYANPKQKCQPQYAFTYRPNCSNRSVISGFSSGSDLSTGSTFPSLSGGPCVRMLQCGQCVVPYHALSSPAFRSRSSCLANLRGVMHTY
ncbi:hypothetical protein PMIN03_002449 [Paraphaeosphaeria minitans]